MAVKKSELYSKPNRDATINVRRKTERSSFRLYRAHKKTIKEKLRWKKYKAH